MVGQDGVCEGGVVGDHDDVEEACRVSNIEQSADDDNYNFLSESVSDEMTDPHYRHVETLPATHTPGQVLPWRLSVPESFLLH